MVDKKFTRQEVEKLEGKNTVFIIENVVYDVTEFMDEHPGGHEVLVNARGNDATEDFDDVGHSLDAKELMKKYIIGELVEEDKIIRQKRTMSWETNKENPGFVASWQFPVVLGIIMTILYTYFFG